ncbi:hypothetical protein Aph02nite_90840 [Actinoplanes philippinensis]|uniref:PH domain-containing protein n=1 Tax=Actinoplanes philippinensis TaxID=35752 RepID=A0A1I2MGI9_9ACTN|nr:hypothetical protein [Actinoplanes philippinensis]GIE83134.1 hypothetical protein Aph02nite_90840 [Actinoplanes philippinensis]SFF90593.1 hypothetical protein SAMN05421541_12944 [Actinoplanes philippinensis]
MRMLSVGVTPDERRTAVFFGLFAALIGLGAATLGFLFAYSSYPRDWFPRTLFTEDAPFTEDSAVIDDVGSGFPGAEGTGFGLIFAIAGLIFLVIGLLWTTSFLVAIVRAVRAAAWLDGTRVHVRGAFRTRSIDLATAYVHQGAVTTRIGYRIVSTPTLEVRDPRTGKALSLRLGAGRLPPNERRALADAMSQGRGNSPDDQDVLKLAETLRTATP